MQYPPNYLFQADQHRTTEQPSLLRRGEKDFEPHGTVSQQDVLSASRAAMHNALSYPRVHAPKTNIIGIYDPEDGRVLVENQRGQHFRTMGQADAKGMHLLPEEALYLIERGNLDIRWPDNLGEPYDGMPFSLQSAYTHFLGRLDLTLERYTVYAGLKRSGYIVQRSSDWYPKGWYKWSWDRDSKDVGEVEPPKVRKTFDWLYRMLYDVQAKDVPPLGPLVVPGLYRSYSTVQGLHYM